MVFFIVMGSAVFSQLLAFSGASRGFLNWATSFDMSPMMVMLIMIGILLILGTMMDQVSILLITVPVFMPLAQSLGFDLIWFSMIMLITVEIGLLTPPFGLLLFVMLGQSPKGTTFGQISLYALPYLGVHLTAVLLILLIPAIALWLPSFL
jgi:TRAP-type C4-dicarboxylate transport system permease large subunit